MANILEWTLTEASSDRAMNPVLQVVDLQVSYYTDAGRARALDGVSLTLNPGEKLGLVGESGSGKSTMALAMMRMIKPPGRIEGGRVIVDAADLTALSEEDMLKARLSKIAYIPQGAMNSLNPVMQIGAQMVDAIQAHNTQAPKADMEERCRQALESVDLKRGVFKMFAHELSGGMKQRVCIAIGILLKPKVIICDEPTSALDVSVQAQILNLLKSLQDKMGLAYLFITHNISVVEFLAHEVAVMYLGRIVETGSVDEVLGSPRHPYTRALLSAVPVIDPAARRETIRLKGDLPSPVNPPAGCYFHPRCPQAMAECRERYPQRTQLTATHAVHCHLY